MSAKRIDMHRLQDLVRYHRMGRSARGIARLLHMGRNTTRGYLEALEKAQLLDGDLQQLPSVEDLKAALAQHAPPKVAPQQESSVSEWRQEIERLTKKGAGPTSIHDYLRLNEAEFDGTLSAVKRACHQVRKSQGVQEGDVAIPIEVAPGQFAQVDFGYAGMLYDPERGVLCKTWAFVLTLAHSRLLAGDLVTDQKVETWLALHDQSFAELGGVPAVMVPDNLKAAVIKAAFSAEQECVLNKSYREQARHYGFQIDPTPPFSPEKKGIVESGVKYVRRNFLATLDPNTDLPTARLQFKKWRVEIANQRIHGTTKRRPQEVFDQEERGRLLPLPSQRFALVVWKRAKVHRDCHVVFEHGLYSVPWQHLGREVDIRVTGSSVTIYLNDERLCTHERVGKGQRSTIEAHLPEHRRDLRHRSREYWEFQAAGIDGVVLEYVKAVFDSDDVLSQLRTVQAIVKHLQKFPVHRAKAACARALHFANYTYRGIKDILRKALDLEPVKESATAPKPWVTKPRFARRPETQIPSPNETTHDHERRADPRPQEAAPLRSAGNHGPAHEAGRQ
jgi:transposase